MRHAMVKSGYVKAMLLAGALLAAVPATAGGSIGVTITAENGAERRAISRFLQAYASGAAAVEVIQKGDRNAAGVVQSGRGNRTVVSQQGTDHSAAVAQRGRGNRLGVFQFGQGTAVDVTQTGRQGATLIFLGGW